MTTLDQLNARGQGTLPGLTGIEFTSCEPGRLTCPLSLRPELLAPNGYLHAGDHHIIPCQGFPNALWQL